MKLKKTEKSNLENKKSLFFEIGLTLALGIALAAFEWATPDMNNDTSPHVGSSLWVEEISEIPRTITPQKPPPPPKPNFSIEIIPDEIEIDEVAIIWDVEAGWDDILIVPDLPDEAIESGDPVYFADKMPQYHGGDLKAFHRHIQDIVEYPEEAIRMQLEGKVFVHFVVDEKGNISDIQIVKKLNPLLDNAVIAALQKTDKWVPGEQAGRKVKVAMSMPISFRLSY